MKPSDSKAARAARKRKSRALEKEREEKAIRHAADLDKLSVAERIEVDQIVKATVARVKAEEPARVAAVIAKHVAKAAKEEAKREPLTSVRADSDGKLIRENIHIPDNPSRWHEERERERPRIEARDPQRPAEGKLMCQWTMAELAAEKNYQRRRNTPHGGGGSSAHGFADPFGIVSHNVRGEGSGSTNFFGWPDDSI
jgi:hypothetical protein